MAPGDLDCFGQELVGGLAIVNPIPSIREVGIIREASFNHAGILVIKCGNTVVMNRNGRTASHKGREYTFDLRDKEVTMADACESARFVSDYGPVVIVFPDGDPV